MTLFCTKGQFFCRALFLHDFPHFLGTKKGPLCIIRRPKKNLFLRLKQGLFINRSWVLRNLWRSLPRKFSMQSCYCPKRFQHTFPTLRKSIDYCYNAWEIKYPNNSLSFSAFFKHIFHDMLRLLFQYFQVTVPIRVGFFVGIPNPTKKNPNPGDFKSHGIFTKKCGIPILGIPWDFRKSPGFWEFPKNPKNEKKI